jgi:putative ABC transport system permease protein
MSYVALSPLDLVLAALLMAINGFISIGFRLGLEKSLAIASVRMVVQLALVGLVLKFVFEQSSPAWTALVALVMLAAAAYESVSRQSRPVKGWMAYALGAGPAFAAGLIATFVAVAGIIGAEPWHAPRYLLPVLGMVLGNAVTGVCLVLDTLGEGLARERNAIEGRLALGATRFEATEDLLSRALKTAMMPILTTMTASGIIALPGMMTGQILAGAEPLEAAKYQIMILFLIAGATGLAVAGAALSAVRMLTDERHRLRLDRLTYTDSKAKPKKPDRGPWATRRQ